MQKILFIANPEHTCKSDMDFARYIADLTRSTLTGIFLEIPEEQFLEEAEASAEPAAVGRNRIVEMSSRDSMINDHQKAFDLSHSHPNIEWLNHSGGNWTVDEIIAETRFADLMIISGDERLSPDIQEPPSRMVRDILSRAECAVLISPLAFTGIEEVVFAYDGSESSMYAIKQFTYLLPEFSETRIMYIQVNDSEEINITRQDKLGEFLKMHYSAVGFHVLHGRAGDELFSYMLGKENRLIVIGAYGRNSLSNSLKKSTAAVLLKTSPLAVFITHQ